MRRHRIQTSDGGVGAKGVRTGVEPSSPSGRGSEGDGLKAIDLGAGYSSSAETLCGRIIAALKSKALLNESVGAGYIDRNWPPALKESGAWPLTSLRQSFLNGSLTRLIDPDSVLKTKIVEFVTKGEFGLTSGQKKDGTYERIWYGEPLSSDEVAFEPNVFLLTKAKAKAIKSGEQPKPGPGPVPKTGPESEPGPEPGSLPGAEPGPDAQTKTIRLVGTIPPEVWNRLGTKIIPKLRSGADLTIGVDFSVTVTADSFRSMEIDLQQAIQDLGLAGKIRIEASE